MCPLPWPPLETPRRERCVAGSRRAGAARAGPRGGGSAADMRLARGSVLSLIRHGRCGRYVPELTRCATDVYVRKLDVVNRGFAGYNTQWAQTVFKQVRPRGCTFPLRRAGLALKQLGEAALRNQCGPEGPPAHDLVWRERRGAPVERAAHPARGVRDEPQGAGRDGAVGALHGPSADHAPHAPAFGRGAVARRG